MLVDLPYGGESLVRGSVEIYRSLYSEEASERLQVFDRHAKASCPYFDGGRFWLITSIDVEGAVPRDEIVVLGKEVSGTIEERRRWLRFASLPSTSG